jgi:hypothetical protein
MNLNRGDVKHTAAGYFIAMTKTIYLLIDPK